MPPQVRFVPIRHLIGHFAPDTNLPGQERLISQVRNR